MAKKFSLTGLGSDPQAINPIANDIGQAIQVGSNINKAYKAEKEKEQEELDQSNYFQANIAYRNSLNSYNQEMAKAGNDLNAQRGVMDKHNASTSQIAENFGLNEQYTSSISSAIENDRSRQESIHRGRVNSYNRNVVDANITDVVANISSQDPNEFISIANSLKVYATKEGFTPQESSQMITTAYANAKKASLNAEDMTLEQAETIVEEYTDTLTQFDDRLKADPVFLQGKALFERVVDEVKGIEKDEFNAELMFSKISSGAMNKKIDTQVARGIYDENEGKLKKKYYYDRRVKEIAAIRAKEVARAKSINSSIKADFMSFSTYTKDTPEQYGARVDNLVKQGLYSKIKGEELKYKFNTKTQKDISAEEKAIHKAKVQVIKQELNTIKATNTISKETTPDMIDNMVLTAANGNAVSKEDISFTRDHRIKYNIRYNPQVKQAIIATPEIGLKSSNDYPVFKEEMTLISNQAAIQGDIDTVELMYKNQNIKGNSSALVSKGLSTEEGVGGAVNYFKGLQKKGIARGVLTKDTYNKAFAYSLFTKVDAEGNTYIEPNTKVKIDEILADPEGITNVDMTKFKSQYPINTDGNSLNRRTEFKIRRALAVELGTGEDSSDILDSMEEQDGIYKPIEGIDLSGTEVDTSGYVDEMKDMVKYVKRQKNAQGVSYTGVSFNPYDDKYYLSTETDKFSEIINAPKAKTYTKTGEVVPLNETKGKPYTDFGTMVADVYINNIKGKGQVQDFIQFGEGTETRGTSFLEGLGILGKTITGANIPDKETKDALKKSISR